MEKVLEFIKTNLYLTDIVYYPPRNELFISDNFSQIHIFDLASKSIIESKMINDTNSFVVPNVSLKQFLNSQISIKVLCFSPNFSYLGVGLSNGSCVIINPTSFTIAVTLLGPKANWQDTLESYLPKIQLADDYVELKRNYMSSMKNSFGNNISRVNSTSLSRTNFLHKKNFDTAFIAITQTDENACIVWRIAKTKTNSQLQIKDTINFSMNGKIEKIFVHPTTNYLCLLHADGNLDVFNLENKVQLFSMGLSNQISSISLDPSGTL